VTLASPAIPIWVRRSIGLLGSAFLVVTLVTQWDSAISSLDLSGVRMLAAFAPLVLSVMANGQAWATIVGSEERNAVRNAYYLALPSKYIPGGFAQPMSQVVLTRSSNVSLRTSVMAFILHSMTIVVATGTISFGLAFSEQLPPLARTCAALGPVSLLLMWRPVLAAIAVRTSRIGRSDVIKLIALPSQRDLLRALSWTLGGVTLSGMGFAGLSGSVAGAPWGIVVSSFSFAFLVGFVAIPFPAGIGVREGVLAAALPLSLPVVIAVSGLHRLLTMAAEFLVMLSTRKRMPMGSTHHENP